MKQAILSSLQKPWIRLLARCRGLRNEEGNALIELAVILCFLGVPLFAGTADMGVLCYDALEVSNAANAGAMYGMNNQGDAQSATGPANNARNDAPDFGTNLGVTTNTYWVCTLALGGTQYPTSTVTSQAAADALCTGTGNVAVMFISVTTTATAHMPFPVPGLPSSRTLTGTSVQMVQP
jgi:Flp pilus assembly protein TadG